MLVVPPELNRNSITVTSLMPPEESGRWLLERMARQLGIGDFARTSILDFGCGVRFTQALLNLGLPIGRYAGVDCHRPLIDFRAANVRDERCSSHAFDVFHPLYNPAGETLAAASDLSLPSGPFDIACMFSVVTHLYPEDAEAVFALPRRRVGATGSLFIACLPGEPLAACAHRSEERNGGRCFYRSEFLAGLLGRAGWAVVERFSAEAPLIGDSFVCRPVEARPSRPQGRTP